MPYVEQIMKKNFIEYASYVIKERSIPHIDDGCKPVQRRILHTLLEIEDGKFHKVANVTGACTKYHPHGDAPIYESLVNLANKEIFIEKQGNFGNPLTGDPASAARYIECRMSELGKELLFSPEITAFVDSYDGRNKEPVTFPAKVPLVLITGAEGIAVVMATTILPHNFSETLQALVSCLKKEPFTLFPDFHSGGFIDVSEYEDGLGKVKLRAKLDTSDSKKIVIKELPYGITTERLMNSIEQATRNGKINISEIDDFTAKDVEIAINLPRGVYTQDIVNSLYAFTDCETSVSLSPIVISQGKPEKMSDTDMIEYFAKRLPKLLGAELKIDEKKSLDKKHARTLERIFIEEAIYKQIEKSKTNQDIFHTVHKGLEIFHKEIQREVTDEDIERLLRIPIRRISMYDIEKYKKELNEILDALKNTQYNIKNILTFTIQYVENIIEKYGADFPRKTTITTFDKVNERDVAQRNLSFMYDSKTGYMGYGVSGGKKITSVSHFDKILLFKKSGAWMVVSVSEKQFIGKDVIMMGLADKEKLEERIFSTVYTNKDGQAYIKRFKIDKFLVNKAYPFLPEQTKLQHLTFKTEMNIVLHYKPVPRLKVLRETFVLNTYMPKGASAKGVRLSTKTIQKVQMESLR